MRRAISDALSALLDHRSKRRHPATDGRECSRSPTGLLKEPSSIVTVRLTGAIAGGLEGGRWLVPHDATTAVFLALRYWRCEIVIVHNKNQIIIG